jgi:hypothetical protein
MASKWEYRVRALPDVVGDSKYTMATYLAAREATLNSLGNDGWELVGVTNFFQADCYYEMGCIAYLKRERI